MSRPITVQYLKYPTALHWRHELTWLGEDAHGIWLGGPVGTIVQRGAEPVVTMRRPFVQLITPASWWSALFNGPGDGHDMPLYVDVTTVARWVGSDRVELIDLDLDVVQRRDGSVYVDDEDEFEHHRCRLRLPGPHGRFRPDGRRPPGAGHRARHGTIRRHRSGVARSGDLSPARLGAV